MRQTIGEFLAAQRKAKGFTQKQVADMLGVSNRTLSAWEQGRAYPDILTLPALSEIYGVTADEILNGEKASSGDITGVITQEKLEPNTPDSLVFSRLSENPQKKLLEKSLKNHRTNVAIATAVGTIGPLCFFLLHVLANVIHFSVFWSLIIADIIIVSALFYDFEKTALKFDGGDTRYTLAVKRRTACGLVNVGLMWTAGAMLYCLCFAFETAFFHAESRLYDSVFYWVDVACVFMMAAALFFIAGGLLKRRERRFLSESEVSILAKNARHVGILTGIWVILTTVFVITALICGNVKFTVDRERDRSSISDFVRRMQTINFTPEQCVKYDLSTADEYGNFFINIAWAYSRAPIDSEYIRVDGNLYLSVAELNWKASEGCYLYYKRYYPELNVYAFEAVAYGKRLLVGGYFDLIEKYPNYTYSAIENRMVIYCFDPEFFLTDSSLPEINGKFALVRSEEWFFERRFSTYYLMHREVYDYGHFATALSGVATSITAGVFIGIYFATRKKIDINI